VSDLWYYAEGDTTRGPMSTADLVAALSTRLEPGRTLLWRHGFSEWRPAAAIAEIAAQLPPAPKPPPPPPPPAPAPLLPPQTRASAGVDAPAADDAAKLTGLDGWLGLVALVQVLGLVWSLLALGRYIVSDVDSVLFQRYPLTIYGEIALMVAFLAYTACTTILFFRRSRRFPRFFIMEWILLAALPLIDTVWVASTLSAYSLGSFADLFTIEPREGGQIAGAILLGSIWTAYTLRSRRVAHTFVK
jgi:uncharacterized protein DUF2569/uncharacterized protein DUF4339